MAQARDEWRASQSELNPERLVFIDETGAATDMARRYGRCPRGQRLVFSVPWGHWKTTTFVAALRVGEIAAPCVFDGPMDGPSFRAYVEQFDGPDPAPGRYRCDGQSPQPESRRHPRSHRGRRRRAALPALVQPKTSTRWNKFFADLKALLRKVAARTIEARIAAIAEALTKVSPQECEKLPC